ncbi:MAG: glutamine amidotransferase family protein [Candidatus Hodarchaeota archaeon]
MRISFANMPKRKDDKIFDACGIAGFLNIDAKLESGAKVKKMMSVLKDRENGLGGGYAVYGAWPNLQDLYCIQLILDNLIAKQNVEEFLKTVVDIIKDEKCPVKNNISPAPIIWRYFIDVSPKMSNPDDLIVELVMHINSEIDGAFCLSSGKNMVVFKGNGWAADIADFYQIERYKGYLWLGHSRFPTNTPGWWGGAHPFNILDYSVVHNGEITSYGTNKRYLEMWGYKCRLLTDTEVVAYLFDLLTRKHRLSKLIACNILAPPYYDEINRMTNGYQNIFKLLRVNYGSAMLNGPFSILVGCNRPVPSIIGLTDRKKLRPLIAGLSNDQNIVYISSEESAIKHVANGIERIWEPTAGTPVIAELGKGIISVGDERNLLPTNLEKS